MDSLEHDRAQLEADLSEAQTLLATYDAKRYSTPTDATIRRWLRQRCDDLNAQLTELDA